MPSTAKSFVLDTSRISPLTTYMTGKEFCKERVNRRSCNARGKTTSGAENQPWNKFGQIGELPKGRREMFHGKPILSLGELRIVWKPSNLGPVFSSAFRVRHRLLNKITIVHPRYCRGHTAFPKGLHNISVEAWQRHRLMMSGTRVSFQLGYT